MLPTNLNHLQQSNDYATGQQLTEKKDNIYYVFVLVRLILLTTAALYIVEQATESLHSTSASSYVLIRLVSKWEKLQ